METRERYEARQELRGVTWFFFMCCWTACRLEPCSWDVAMGRRSCTHSYNHRK